VIPASARAAIPETSTPAIFLYVLTREPFLFSDPGLAAGVVLCFPSRSAWWFDDSLNFRRIEPLVPAARRKGRSERGRPFPHTE
jgi:hypothetical protein